MERYRWLVVALFAVPLLSGIAYLVADRMSDPDPPLLVASDAPSDIRVYVAGAVRNPGVYPMAEGDRWIDAVEAAGGGTEEADLTAINLARRIQDEDQIIVPRLAQGIVAGASQKPLVNINTASQTELVSLPGIGEVRAGRIIDSRATDGSFASIEELLSRKLIPQSVFDSIAPLITVY